MLRPHERHLAPELSSSCSVHPCSIVNVHGTMLSRKLAACCMCTTYDGFPSVDAMVLLQCSCLLTLHCFLRELQEAGVALQKVNSRVRHFGMVFVFLVVKATLAVLGWYCRLPAASDGSSRQQIFASGRCPDPLSGH